MKPNSERYRWNTPHMVSALSIGQQREWDTNMASKPTTGLAYNLLHTYMIWKETILPDQISAGQGWSQLQNTPHCWVLLVFLQPLPTIHSSHQSLEQMHWFEAIFKIFACAISEVAEVAEVKQPRNPRWHIFLYENLWKLDEIQNLASATSKMTSWPSICFKDWWELWIVGKNYKNVLSSEELIY